jgi:peptide/nickel transport system permease protein
MSCSIAALVVLVVGGFAGVPLIWTLVLSFALVVLGAMLVNGRYVLRRLAVVVPTILLVTAFTFWLQNGRGNKHDLAFNILGPGATDAGVAQIVKEFHLDEPLYRRYLLWLSDALRGNLGKSAIQGQQVSTAIAKALPVTLQLMVYAQILALALAIPAGVYAAYRASKRGDRVTSTAALFFLSVPNFVLAVVLVLFLAVGGISVWGHQVGWEILPASRYVPFGESPANHFRSMALPTIALSLALAAGYMRVLRSDMIATLQENFVTTAKAKGVPDRRILWAHALRPSSFTLLTVVARDRHLSEGFSRRAGRGRCHRRRLRADQFPRGPALRRSRPKGAPCPCLTQPKLKSSSAFPLTRLPTLRSATASGSWASGSGPRWSGSRCSSSQRCSPTSCP